MPKRLTPEEIGEIIFLYQNGFSPKEIGKKFNILNNSITRILRKNNIPRNQKLNISKEIQIKICNDYISGFNSTELSKKYNIHSTTVCRILNRNNVRVRENHINKRKLELNEKWLDEIDCEEKAYFLGLFAADGNISKSKNDISLRLHSKDKAILEKLSNYFYGCNRVSSYVEDVGKKSTPVSKLVIYSKYLKLRLEELGITPNKCKSIRFVRLDQNLNRHFIRGLLDGDGCISIRSDGRAVVDITGNEYMIKDLSDILNEKNVNHGVYFSDVKNSWSLQIGRRIDIKNFLDWIYNDSGIYIERKYEKYLKVKLIQASDFSHSSNHG